jgi:hypothetical protein
MLPLFRSFHFEADVMRLTPPSHILNAPMNGSYDTHAKRVIRAHLVPFWTDGVTQEVLHQVGAWFFAGPHSDEYKTYLAHGIMPEQLLSFEWHPGVATMIRAHHPELPLASTALGAFLEDTSPATGYCDWANLDFDGTAWSFRQEIIEVINRLRIDIAPRLAVTSFASRDPDALQGGVLSAAMLHAMDPEAFVRGADGQLVENARSGLSMDAHTLWHTFARESVVTLMVLRAVGGRSYPGEDAQTASVFATMLDKTLADFSESLDDDVRRCVAGGTQPLPMHSELADAVARRFVPLAIDRWLRFAYQTENGRWIWTWMFRFGRTSSDRPSSMLSWLRTLMASPPPLHVIDHTGRPVRGAKQQVCAWCPTEHAS